MKIIENGYIPTFECRCWVCNAAIQHTPTPGVEDPNFEVLSCGDNGPVFCWGADSDEKREEIRPELVAKITCPYCGVKFSIKFALPADKENPARVVYMDHKNKIREQLMGVRHGNAKYAPEHEDSQEIKNSACETAKAERRLVIGDGEALKWALNKDDVVEALLDGTGEYRTAAGLRIAKIDAAKMDDEKVKEFNREASVENINAAITRVAENSKAQDIAASLGMPNKGTTYVAKCKNFRDAFRVYDYVVSGNTLNRACMIRKNGENGFDIRFDSAFTNIVLEKLKLYQDMFYANLYSGTTSSISVELEEYDNKKHE